ncbi:MAG: hypothetical protein H6581_10380 [Bacteroidia bacterium]|nr:hypothetical protein [Bacteroidia bacterium]
MKTKITLLMMFAVFGLAALSGCGKEGFGGNAQVTGLVRHHSKAIPNATVYIKFDATESPGTDAALYDASVEADEFGAYTVSELKRGDYFFFGSGYDSTISLPVVGGIPVHIDGNKDQLTINVPVTE